MRKPLTLNTSPISVSRNPTLSFHSLGTASFPAGKRYAHTPAAAAGIVAQNRYRMEEAPINMDNAISSARMPRRLPCFRSVISRAVSPTYRLVSTACGT